MSDVEFRKLAKEMAGRQRSSSSILLLTISYINRSNNDLGCRNRNR